MNQLSESSFGSPLDGIVVADFTRVLAGPLATMTLADLGAAVIKVERPGIGDETRAWGPPWSDNGMSSYFESVNRSKRSMALDLSDTDDLATALALTDRADVVIENFKPGTMDRLGLGYPTVSERNGRVVYCSISGFGSGRGRDVPGYDFIVQAVGGLMSITGDADSAPTKVGVALIDVITGKDAVIAILAALQGRQRTGRGERVEVNLLTSCLTALVNQGQAALETGKPGRRMGNRHPSIAPYETLLCRDVPIAVACGNDRQFARLVGVLGVPDLAVDPRFGSNAARVQNRDALVDALESRLAAADGKTWVQRLAAARVPAGEVSSIPEALSLAERLDLDPTIDVGKGWTSQVGHPIRWSSYDAARPSPPPALGAHTEDLRAWLAEAALGEIKPRREGTA